MGLKLPSIQRLFKSLHYLKGLWMVYFDPVANLLENKSISKNLHMCLFLLSPFHVAGSAIKTRMTLTE